MTNNIHIQVDDDEQFEKMKELKEQVRIDVERSAGTGDEAGGGRRTVTWDIPRAGDVERVLNWRIHPTTEVMDSLLHSL